MLSKDTRDIIDSLSSDCPDPERNLLKHAHSQSECEGGGFSPERSPLEQSDLCTDEAFTAPLIAQRRLSKGESVCDRPTTLLERRGIKQSN